MKFSVIVPVYNAEKYLERCIKSIVNQTYKGFEVIVINDGSTDNSLTLLQELGEKDERINLINRKNKGVSSARNEGIQKARGEYILFVDADDYIDKKLLENLDQYAVNTGLIVYNFRDNGRVNKIEFQLPDVCDKESTAMLISGINSFRGFVWNKAFKRSIIIENNIGFREDIYMCEDLCFCIDFIEKNNLNTRFLLEPLYNYEHRGISASANIFNRKRASVIQAYDYLLSKSFIRNNEKVYICYKHQYIRHCLSLWKMTVKEKEFIDYKRDFIKRIKDENWSFTTDNLFDLKYRMIFVIIKLFG